MDLSTLNSNTLTTAAELELPNMVLSSGLVEASWSQISALYADGKASAEPLRWSCRIEDEGRLTVIAFMASHRLLEAEENMVSSETLKQHNFPHFESLCSPGNPSFSIHGDAIALFASHFDPVFKKLRDELITTDQTLSKTPLIITGHSLGGSVAALFTLFLLDTINPKSKRLPLCITFGSPLIGDEGLRRAVSERSRWSSCFLHVAGSQDQVPSLFVPLEKYRPFGTFLFCSQVGFSCVEDPDSVLMLMKGLEITRSLVSCDEDYYGKMINIMNNMFLLRRNSQFGLFFTNPSPLQAVVILQLEAIGITMTSENELNIKLLIQELVKKHEQSGKRAKPMNPDRKLNEIKIKMAYLGRYKKKNAKGKGYYDSYKISGSPSDRDVTRLIKFLQAYWQPLVEEAERKPQKETAYIRDTWLFAGTNYRRMVEPLDIAEYYREGKTDYRNRGRSRHYILLEQWKMENVPRPAGSDPVNKRRNVAGNLTEDSCFWADVEEAVIRTRRFRNCFAERDSILEQLSGFEESVMNQISDSAVSPEVFLEESTFMGWWEEYREIRGESYSSSLANFMKNQMYKQYANGVYWENHMQIC